MTKIEILRTVIGSRAHGIADPDSDTDYRGVFVVPTIELLSIGPRASTTSWIEGSGGDRVDDTAYEIGHFLLLATKSNPSILEVFRAPVVLEDLAPIVQRQLVRTGPGGHGAWVNREEAWGYRLRELFPHAWSSRGVYEAFRGYGKNQRTKMLDNKDGRYHKYASAWLRTLYNAERLLTEGTFELSVKGTEIEFVLRAWRRGESAFVRGQPLPMGEVVDACYRMEERVEAAYLANPDKQTDVGPLNAYLLDLRKEFWEV